MTTLDTATVRDVFVGTGGDESYRLFDRWLRDNYVERISDVSRGAPLAILHVREVEKMFHPSEDRTYWIMAQELRIAIAVRARDGFYRGA